MACVEDIFSLNNLLTISGKNRVTPRVAEQYMQLAKEKKKNTDDKTLSQWHAEKENGDTE